MNRINSFRDDYYFLSNMYPCKIIIGKYVFDCAEAAFQAYKNKKRIRDFEGINGFEAKKLGRNVELRPDWNEIKVKAMLMVLRCKFNNPELRAKLLETGNAELVEGNNWGDCYWGECNGTGRNILGKLLMGLREEYATGSDEESDPYSIIGKVIITAREECVTKIANTLDGYIANKNMSAFHKMIVKGHYMTVDKPLINQGNMSGEADVPLREYDSVILDFSTKSRFKVTINTHVEDGHEAIISSGFGSQRVERELSSETTREINKIFEMFYSYEGSSEAEREYGADYEDNITEDEYFDKSVNEYVNRFARDVNYNWNSRYESYTSIIPRTYRDDEPLYDKTFHNSQYAELVALNKIKFESTSTEKKYKIRGPEPTVCFCGKHLTLEEVEALDAKDRQILKRKISGLDRVKK